MTIYIVYEIDQHNTISTAVIKKLDTSRKKTNDFFEDHRESFFCNSDSGYTLHFAKYETGNSDIDGNILNEIEPINNSNNPY